MPLGTRQALPPLKLSMHVYSPDPARRVVIIDGARLLEGEIVSGELKVSQITSEGVVLAARRPGVPAAAWRPLTVFVRVETRRRTHLPWATLAITLGCLGTFLALTLMPDDARLRVLTRWGAVPTELLGFSGWLWGRRCGWRGPRPC